MLLYYLTEVGNVPDQLITQGFFVGTNELPQEYLFNQIGGQTFRGHFIDWAAHMTNHFDFISPVQSTRNEQEWRDYADPADDNEFIEILEDTGTNGWVRPHDTLVTTAWSFNTYKIRNASTRSYLFELNGDQLGSKGGNSYFQGQVLVQGDNGDTRFENMSMEDDQEGSLVIDVTPADTAIYLIIASMPEIFGDSGSDFQTFSYEIRISEQTVSAVSTPGSKARIEVARYNLLGQQVNKEYRGIQLILYNDHSLEKSIYLKED